MKTILLSILTLSAFAVFAGEPDLGRPSGPQMCTTVMTTLKHPATGECRTVTNGCAAQALIDKFWKVASAEECKNGRGRPSRPTLPPQICGPGGTRLMNPNTGECTMTLNTCETAKLRAKGWVTTNKCPLG